MWTSPLFAYFVGGMFAIAAQRTGRSIRTLLHVVQDRILALGANDGPKGTCDAQSDPFGPDPFWPSSLLLMTSGLTMPFGRMHRRECWCAPSSHCHGGFMRLACARH